MKILVNGAWHDTEAVKLAVALGELGYGEQVVATAVNGEFVGAEARAAHHARRGRSRGSAGADAGRLRCWSSTEPRSARGCCSARRAIPRPRC